MKSSALFGGLLISLALAAFGCSSETNGSGGAGGTGGGAGGAGGGAGGAGGAGGEGGAGGGAGGAGGGSGGAGGSGGGSASTDCSAANTTYINAPDIGVVEAGTGATRLPADPAFPALGVTWIKDGVRFFLVRDGDAMDGAFGSVQTYDASKYPFHMLLVSRPDGWSDEQCAAEPDKCKAFYGLSGTWDITSTTPLQGKIAIGTLTKDENCWAEGPPLDTTKCMVLQGEVNGCFNVD